MNYSTFNRIMQAIITYDRRRAASCIRVAAEMSGNIWIDYEAKQFHSYEGKRLLDTFDDWVIGLSSDEQLLDCYNSLFKLLPRDLSTFEHVCSGLSGYSILGIATIAVTDCGDAYEYTVENSLIFAATAWCGTNPEYLDLSPIVLSDCEMMFLDTWWDSCQKLST
jgi:hypothetical protein